MHRRPFEIVEHLPWRAVCVIRLLRQSTMEKMFKPIALSGALILALAASPAKADTIVQYYFSPDASITDGTGAVESLSGGFLWDTTTDSLVSINTTVTGSDLTYTFTAPPDPTANLGAAWEIDDPTNDNISLVVAFANDLGLGQSDQLALVSPLGYGASAVYYPSPTCCQTLVVTGSADVPEPATMAIISVGVGGLGLVRRRQAMRRMAWPTPRPLKEV
jgi:hypothetical protein